MTALPDQASCYRAVSSRDTRFDGWIYVGVSSTGIYCRPSCPATTPKQTNCSFYAASGAAQHAGFRACLRCRPDAIPGSPQWDVRADVVGRAMRLIADGVVDRDGVPGLARRVGYSERQLSRLLLAELGATPVALARAQRAHSARLLIDGTDLSMADIAFAAGFASVRQFNDVVRTVFARPPTALRQRAAVVGGAGSLRLRLPFRTPFDADSVYNFQASHAMPGVEYAERTTDGWTFARTVRLPHNVGVVALRWDGNYLEARLALADLRDLASAVSRSRRMFDLDADPLAVDQTLAADPAFAEGVHQSPGLRVPGTADPHEVAFRALVGQQISLAGGTSAAAKLAARFGDPIGNADFPTLSRLFPTSTALAAADPETLPMPRARGRALVGLAGALSSGALSLDAGSDRTDTRAALLALPGIGPWTADYIAMRGLGDPDVFLVDDLIIRRNAAARGLPSDRSALVEHSKRYAPWRSYATLHLWRDALRSRAPA